MAEQLAEQLAESVLFWVLLVLVLLVQSTWLFIDARKRDHIPWFWGLWGLIQFPTPLILYWLIVRLGVLSRWRNRDK